MHNAYVASDLLPATAFWFVVVLAALPAFSIMRQSKRGRARSAIAYLAGLFFGLAATIGLSLALATWVSTPLRCSMRGLRRPSWARSPASCMANCDERCAGDPSLGRSRE
jgi:hypothetical protein